MGATSRPARRDRGARWLAAPLVGAVFVAGVWVAGGVITDSFKASMALTIAWGAIFAAACLAYVWRRPRLRVPVIGGYVLTAAVVGGYLAWTTLHDKVVHEKVVTGVPMSAARQEGPKAVRENVQLASGEFTSLEHASRGTAAVVRLPGGQRRLTLTGFSTSAGPDLRVRIVVGEGNGDGGSNGAKDLGALKGNKGNQQYKLPSSVDLGRYRTVVIWCRAFSAGFAKATLRPS